MNGSITAVPGTRYAFAGNLGAGYSVYVRINSTQMPHKITQDTRQTLWCRLYGVTGAQRATITRSRLLPKVEDVLCELSSGLCSSLQRTNYASLYATVNCSTMPFGCTSYLGPEIPGTVVVVTDNHQTAWKKYCCIYVTVDLSTSTSGITYQVSRVVQVGLSSHKIVISIQHHQYTPCPFWFFTPERFEVQKSAVVDCCETESQNNRMWIRQANEMPGYGYSTVGDICIRSTRY